MIRVASAVVLLVVLLGTLWWLPGWATLGLVAGAAALGAAELAGFARAAHADVPAWFVGVAAALVAMSFVLPAWPGASAPPDILAVVLGALIIAAGALALTLGPPSTATLTRATVMTMAPVYVGLPLGVFAWVQLTLGPMAATWLLAIIAVSDSAQYYSGRTFGRHKLAPAVSPAKTIEGAVGGLIVVAAVGALSAPHAIPGVTALGGGVLGLVLATVGIIGDLFESLLKRGVGVKDSSHLIPGHGGVLDRIDSHLFAAPAFYFFMRFFA